MGIDVSPSKEICLNINHENRLVTCPTKNPRVVVKNGLRISCVYRRTKRGDKKDGNPFIYALKGIKGYSISKRELSFFRSGFYSILKDIIDNTSVDFIIPMPSSHPIANFLSKKIKNNCNSEHLDDFFKKKKVSDVLDSFDYSSVKIQHRSDVNRQLAIFSKIRGNEEVSLKNMPTKIREYFPPIQINPKYREASLHGNVLLVDDLLSTGTTLMSAKNELYKVNAKTTSAICLLSDLGR